ncbi:hypothetical protein Glove_344g2 [Diversispora epigaea]|uniref:C2H2-type domain-containing protein n=1 Tax=Diversispora epigaea TaxID=1348612 RepID=A0A397HNN9_9GLOM|nr:hypothetical protein Glove_344g2 [Diversispora epigaea]
MPSILLNATCSTCGKIFKNSKGLTRHKQYIHRYNQRRQDLDELPENTIAEFKQILIAEIHKKLLLNFRSMGKKSISIPCPENHDTYQVLSTIFNSDQWGKKKYSQNQQTYVVCLDSSSQNISVVEEINPLEKLLQLSKKKQKIIRKPRFLRGEILIEWKNKIFKEINGNVFKAGYLFINFYISQSCK